MHHLPLIFLLLFSYGCNPPSTDQSAEPTKPATDAPQYEDPVDVNPLNDPTPLAELITYDGIGPGAHLISPYVLKGKAIGHWFQGGKFPVTIVGEDGNLIASSPGKTTGEWTQTGWVPYQSKLAWIAGPDTRATLILSLALPTGGGEHKIRSVEIPVILK